MSLSGVAVLRGSVLDLFSFAIYYQYNSRLPILIVYARPQDYPRSSIGIVAES